MVGGERRHARAVRRLECGADSASSSSLSQPSRPVSARQDGSFPWDFFPRAVPTGSREARKFCLLVIRHSHSLFGQMGAQTHQSWARRVRLHPYIIRRRSASYPRRLRVLQRPAHKQRSRILRDYLGSDSLGGIRAQGHHQDRQRSPWQDR